jgi:hypothetical protein
VSDEYREIEVVEVGSGPPKPARPPRSGNRTDVLLTLMVVGVFVGAACSAFTAWTVYEQTQDQRDLNCAYLTLGGGEGDRAYDDLEDYEKGIADAMDCDIEGR